MSIRMMIVMLATVLAAQTGQAAAQTRYFDRTPSAEELEQALTPQTTPIAPHGGPPAAAAPNQQPPMRANEGATDRANDGEAQRRGPRLSIAPTSIPVPREPPKVGLTVTFAFNSVDLTAESRRVLDVLAIAINRLPQFRFQIEGHTDSVGGDAFNLELSQRRAAAVVQYLVLTHNISPARLAAIGFGKRKLRDPVHPTDGINRRVEVLNLGPA
jgi:outer membrane protein OmpA-like peptidoglycan-associated protein